MARDKPKGLIVREFGEGGDGIGKRAGGTLLALRLNRGQVWPHLDEGEAASDGVGELDRAIGLSWRRRQIVDAVRGAGS